MPVRVGTATPSNFLVSAAQASALYVGSTAAWTSTPVAAKLVFPGVAGNYLSLPYTATPMPPDDIEIVARVQPTGSWVPGTSIYYGLYSRYPNIAGQRSHMLRVGPTSALVFSFSLDGTAALTATSTVIVPFGSGVAGWVKVTRTASTGTHRFYTAADAATEPTSWTQLGANVTNTAGALFANAIVGVTRIGDINNASGPLPGRLYRVIVRNVIDGAAVLDIHEDNANANIPSQFTAAVGGPVSAVVTAGNQIIQPRVP